MLFVLLWVAWVANVRRWCKWRTCVGNMLVWVVCKRGLTKVMWVMHKCMLHIIIVIVVIDKLSLRKKAECLILKWKWKNVQKRFEQGNTRKTWLQERVLVFGTGNDRILNMPESSEICANVDKYVWLSVTLWICLNMRK